MATLRKRGKIWVADYYDRSGVRQRRSTGCTDKKAAQMWLARELRDAQLEAVGAGDPFKKHNETPLTEHLAAFRMHVLGRRKRPTQKALTDLLSRLQEFFAHAEATHLRDLSAEKASAWLEHLRAEGEGFRGRKGLSERAIDKRKGFLRDFGKWLVESERAPKNPFVSLKRSPRAVAADRRYVRRDLKSADLLSFLDAVRDYERQVCYVVAITTGLRRSELAALTWRDLRGEALRLSARHTKNDEDAVLPLHPLAVGLLDELRRQRREAEQQPGGLKKLRGPGNYKHAPQGSADDHRLFNSVPTTRTLRGDLEHAGIEPGDFEGGRVDFHALRVSFASLLAAAGVPLAVAQRLLRHSDPKLTSNVYTKLGYDEKAQAVAVATMPLEGVTGFVPKRGHAAAVCCSYGAPRKPAANAQPTASGSAATTANRPETRTERRPGGSGLGPRGGLGELAHKDSNLDWRIQSPPAVSGDAGTYAGGVPGSVTDALRDPAQVARALLHLAADSPEPEPLLEAARVLLAWPRGQDEHLPPLA